MEQIKSVFVVDDEVVQTTMLKDYLTKFPWLTVKTFNSGEECIKNLHENPDIIFLDYNFDFVGNNALNGVEILNTIKGQCPDTQVIMMSAQDNIEVALNTVKYGAYDYIVKNESAFQRAESAIFSIIERLNLKSEARRYKRLTYLFAAVMVAMIIAFIFLLSTDSDFHFYNNR